MTKASRAILGKTAEILNRHIAEVTPLGKELTAGSEASRSTVGFVNELLREVAEGGTLVCATEIDGTLLGFIPRADVTLPAAVSHSGTAAPVKVPPKGPDSGK